MLLRSTELRYMLICLLGHMLVNKLLLGVKGTEGHQGLMGGAQVAESSCVRSGLGSDIHFELILRGESRGGFYFLIQYDKGEKVAVETAWTVTQT